jgi:purine-binding chemotaxis protein CheW
VQDLQELVVVRLGGDRYALPMASVGEVGRPPSLTRVPGLPGWIAGVANWRGRVLAVLDLRPLLGAAPGELDRRGRVLVLSAGGMRAGLLVEQVIGTVASAPAHVEPVLASLRSGTATLLAGQLTDAEGPCGLLDVDAVFALSGTLPRARRAG